jgi:hypothetical protein
MDKKVYTLDIGMSYKESDFMPRMMSNSELSDAIRDLVCVGIDLHTHVNFYLARGMIHDCGVVISFFNETNCNCGCELDLSEYDPIIVKTYYGRPEYIATLEREFLCNNVNRLAEMLDIDIAYMEVQGYEFHGIKFGLNYSKQ